MKSIMNRFLHTLLIVTLLGMATAGIAVVPVTPSEPYQVGDFYHVVHFDPMTDVDRSMVYNFAHVYPGYAYSAGVAVRCESNSIHGYDVFLDFDMFVARDVNIVLDYRFDDGVAVMGAVWGGTTDGKGAFVPVGDVVDFVTGLRSSDLLRVRVYTPDGTPFNYSMSLAGFTDAFSRLDCARSLLL